MSVIRAVPIGVGHYLPSRVVENAETRKAYAERFELTQKFAQFDPWQQQIADKKLAAEYKPLKLDMLLAS